MAKAPKKEPRRAISLGDTALSTLPADSTEGVQVGKGFMATVNGLDITGQPSFKASEDAGLRLRVFERGAQFALGDYILYIEERFGEEAAQILDASSGWSLKTCSNYRWIATRIAKDRRRMDRLGIRHHQLVAKLSAAQQVKWLTKAAADDEENPWTVARLRKALEDGEDLPVSDWYVLVGPLSSGQVQDQLMARLEAEGLVVKAVQRRKRKAEQEAA